MTTTVCIPWLEVREKHTKLIAHLQIIYVHSKRE